MTHALSLALSAAALLAGCTRDTPPAREQVRGTAYGEVTTAPSSPAVAAAEEALRVARPWKATMRLAAAMRSPATQPSDAVIVAATAAAQWEGWSEVRRLLDGRSWLDSAQQGCGLALLARAALEQGDAQAALDYATRAVEHRDAADIGMRFLLRARALDRLKRDDEARAAYLDAASHLSQVSDWLVLRAAGVTHDAEARAALLARVRGTLARSRITITDANALERSGDIAAAIPAFAKAGRRAHAAELRWNSATDSSQRLAAQSELMAIVSSMAGTSEARAAVDVMDRLVKALTPGEELLVARSAVASGPTSRAASAYERAASARLLTPRDWLDYGSLLFRLGRYAQSASALANVPANDAHAARATYQRGRALFRAGRAAEGNAAFRLVLERYPGDASAASGALYSIADAAADDGRVADARSAFRRIAEQYPSSSLAPLAGFRAGFLSWLSGDTRMAVTELRAVSSRYPKDDDAAAALYWEGRALASSDKAAAESRWRTVIENHPLSYYALLAGKQLGSRWTPASDTRIPADAGATQMIAQGALLDSLGMDLESRLVLNDVEDEHRNERAFVAVAQSFLDAGMPNRAIHLARRALAKGARVDAQLVRLLYPNPFPAMIEEARSRKVDPALAASLTRQESMFYPRATSAVGARGLMQVMPSVGASVARGLGFPVWDPALLYQPDANIAIGMAHLDGLLEKYGSRTDFATAAYNAGESRVTRWKSKPKANDMEAFVEQIPYEETRNYVKVVLRGADLYRE